VSADPADLVSTDDVLEATYMQARTVRARIRGLEAVLRPDHVALVPALADLNHAALVLVSRLDIMSRRQREHPECWRRIVSAVRWLRSSMMGVLARADIYRALACSPSASLAAQLRRLEGLVSMLEYVAGDTASMVKRFSDVAHARRHDAGLAAHSLRWSGVRKGHGWSST
jgi:hypothetical protein